MTTETVMISREEHVKLKKHEKVDEELLNKIVGSLEDVKAGRIRRVR